MWCNYEQIYPVTLMSTLNEDLTQNYGLSGRMCILVCVWMWVCLVKGRGMKNKPSSSIGQSH